MRIAFPEKLRATPHLLLTCTVFILVFILAVSQLLPGKYKHTTRAGTHTENLFLALDSEDYASIHTGKSNYKPTKIVTSPEYKAAFAFDALSVSWDQQVPIGTAVNLFMRFYERNAWTDWKYIVIEEDEKEITAENPSGKKNILVLANLATKFQYRVELFSIDPQKTPTFKNPQFNYFNSHTEADPTEIVNPTELLAALNVVSSSEPKIVSRSAWGADESLRIYDQPIEDQDVTSRDDNNGDNTQNHDENSDEIEIVKEVTHTKDGKQLIWPLEYTNKVNRFIIHHTATSTTGILEDPQAALRSIYYYHAVTRRWGDIGYNYIIDQEGKIYQGRAGGEKVVGGHAGPANKGSIGIAVIGNYQEKEPSAQVIQSLINLIDNKAKLHSIKTNGFAPYKGKLVSTVLGHRDVMNTTCPGDKIYFKLPSIRLLTAKGTSDSQQPMDEEFPFIEVSDRALTIIKPESSTQVEIKLKNEGTQTWTKETYLVHDINKSRQEIILFSRPSQNNPELVAYLKEQEVKPGMIGTFKISISSDLTAGLTNYYLFPVFNGTKKASSNLLLPIIVQAPEIKFTLVQSALPKGKAKVGTKIPSKYWIKLQNTGNIAWSQHGKKAVCLQSELIAECIGSLSQDEIKPGEIGYFELHYTPPKAGVVTDHIFLSMPEFGKAQGPDLQFTLDVEGNTYQASLVGFTGKSVLKPRQVEKITLEVKNTGDLKWKNQGKSALKLIPVTGKNIKISSIEIPQAEIDLNQTATITFELSPPNKEGSYDVYFWLRIGNKPLSKNPFKYHFFVTRAPDKFLEKNQPHIRILISSFSENPRISADGNYKLYFGDQFKKNLTKEDTVEVVFMENQYRLKIGREALVSTKPPRFKPQEKVIIQIVNFDHKSSWNPEINYNRYRGILEVLEDDGKLVVINELPIEDYLKGLAEAPTQEELIEKAKAITVAARTYAIFYTDPNNRKFPGKLYDGNDDPAVFQYYLGYEFEKRAPSVVKAVDETQGVVVTYKGQIVKTPYFSSSDGRTRSAEEVFGWTHTPYLQSVPDPYCEGKELRGHGVGLSGCGAEGAAKDGKTYIQILKYYYQDVRIVKKY